MSLKVCTGTKFPTRGVEADILASILESPRQTPGRGNIIELLDAFIIRGPNGFHECLVTELAIPLDDEEMMKKCFGREVMRQVLLAFSFLHNKGIVHGG